MNVAASVLLVTLAVVGAVAVLRELSLRLFCGGNDAGCSVLYVTRLPSDSEALEYALRGALAKCRWRAVRMQTTVCVDGALSEKERRICRAICREYGFQNMITKEELIKSLDKCTPDRV